MVELEIAGPLEFVEDLVARWADQPGGSVYEIEQVL